MLAFTKRRNRPPRHGRSIDIDGVPFPIEVVDNVRSRRLTLRIVPGGERAKVTVPPHVGDAEIDEFIARNRSWLTARLARLPARVEIRPGCRIPFRGADHRIVEAGSAGRPGRVVSIGEREGEPALFVPGPDERMAGRLLTFMKARARRELDLAVTGHAGRLDVRPRAIRITDSVSRWGSCSSARTLSFSWRIIMAPPPVLDYLAAHEVAHLREMNHSPAFWRLVGELCPQFKSHKSWLRANGPTLHAVRFG